MVKTIEAKGHRNFYDAIKEVEIELIKEREYWRGISRWMREELLLSKNFISSWRVVRPFCRYGGNSIPYTIELEVSSEEKADKLREQFPNVRQWEFGGHEKEGRCRAHAVIQVSKVAMERPVMILIRWPR